jgi:hypothetical protein
MALYKFKRFFKIKLAVITFMRARLSLLHINRHAAQLLARVDLV